MSKKTIMWMLAAVLTLAACKKEPEINPTPDGTDTTGGGTPAVVEKAVYSVSSTQKVVMSKGNLQYQASTNTFRFAPHAWDAVKEGNTQASASYDGWIDNFGWATSGYEGYYAYLTSPYNSAYYTGGSIDGTEYDWGVHNAIVNGENTDPAGTWRTLSTEEWEYLLENRSASTLNGVENARYAIATVEGQKGIILIPDHFEMPANVPQPRTETINIPSPYASNIYSTDEWNAMEEAGCVFMPSVGCMNVNNNTMVSVDYLGCYWTSTYVGEADNMLRAGQIMFNPNIVETGSAGVQFRRPVRLAKNL